MYRIVIILIICLQFTSCDYFRPKPTGEVIARVKDSYLYKEDILKLVSESTSPEDSAVIVNNYITRWATQQLLLSQAKINLPLEQQETYNKLVNDYKKDLYTEAYRNIIVMQQLDSTVSESQMREYYEQNKDNFKLNDDLYKARYVVVDPTFLDRTKVKENLRRFNKKDIASLNELSVKFNKFNLNDSVWLKEEALVEDMPGLKGKTDERLKKSNFTEMQDSLEVYLVQVKDVLHYNDIAPLSYVKPTIKQIILNKRKLELLKKLDKDITKDALKNNDFEIY